MFIDLSPALVDNILLIYLFLSYLHPFIEKSLWMREYIGIVGVVVAPTYKAHYPNQWPNHAPVIIGLVQVHYLFSFVCWFVCFL